jgi:aryl-alcohol dehydrogenase-like predicted oxidoreductase
LGEVMQQMVREGKVRFLGITAWDGHPTVVEPLMASGLFHTAQILYNVLNRTAAAEPPAGFDDADQKLSLQTAQRYDVGVIGIRAHAAGALADRLDRKVAAGSDVARDFERARKFMDLRKTPFRTLSQVALRFCLDHPAIGTVVPGFKNAGEVEDAVACAGLPALSAN